MDDAKEFRETQYALTLLGVGSKEHGYKLICSITPNIYSKLNYQSHYHIQIHFRDQIL